MASVKWKIAQWFELRWWSNYLRTKEKAAYLDWKKNYWLKLLDQLPSEIKPDTSKTIADLGCGPAGIFIALPNHAVTAVDPLLGAYETQIPFFDKRDYPRVKFVESTIEEFAPSQKFDTVFCMNAINHVYDIEKGFRKLQEVCAENGMIIISIDAHNFAFFKYLFRIVPGDVLHPHQYSLDEYQNFIATDGWKIAAAHLLKKEFFFNHYLLITKK